MQTARREVYERLDQPAERSDMLIFEILYHFGSVYTDTDFECLRSIEPLLDGVELPCAYSHPVRLNNAIMGSVPDHPIIAQGLRELRPRDTYGAVDTEGTGPFGNSSASIREGSFLGTPAVPVGTRQHGRERGANVVEVDHDQDEIVAAIREQVAHGPYERSTPFGDGTAGRKIANVLADMHPAEQKRLLLGYDRVVEPQLGTGRGG